MDYDKIKEINKNIVELKIRSRLARILRSPLILYKHYQIARRRKKLSRVEALTLAFKLTVLTVRKIELTF